MSAWHRKYLPSPSVSFSATVAADGVRESATKDGGGRGGGRDEEWEKHKSQVRRRRQEGRGDEV